MPTSSSWRSAGPRSAAPPEEAAIPVRDPFAILEVEGGSIALAAAAGPVVPGSTAVWVYADDVDGLVGRVRRSGVVATAEPGDREWGERVASVRDPDGHLVHVGAPGGA